MNHHTGALRAEQLSNERLAAAEFISAARDLLERGWHPIPIGGASGKKLLQKGITGYNGRDVNDPDKFREWAEEFGNTPGGLNIGTRVPVGVIGIDGDFYAGKHGWTSLQAAERLWGTLPPTYVTTARMDGSGIRWYRLPESCHDHRVWKSVGVLPGGDVEVIQRHHRYAAAPPSVHKSGARYRVLGPDGLDCAGLPRPAELPLLPNAWVDGLGNEGSERNPRGTEAEGRGVLAGLADGPMDDAVSGLFRGALEAFQRNGSRYDAMNSAVIHLVRRGAGGAMGVPTALRLLQSEYVRAVASARGSEREAEKEFSKAQRDAGRILAAEVDRGQFESYDAFTPGGVWHQDTPCRGIDRTYARERGWIDANGVVAESRPLYSPVSAADLAQPVPPMEWLIRGVWPRHSFGPMGGEKKTLKSYNLLAISVAVASGEPLFGEFEVMAPGPVLYYVGEGGQRPFMRRLQAVARAYKVDLADLPISAVFQVGSLAGSEFVDALRRNLDQVQPALIILDPLYAFHPPGVEAQNLYARGRMLAELSGQVADESALIVADHFKKNGASGAGSLDLDSIAQSGMGQWADSWILQRHRETPDLDQGAYRLAAEFGSRQWGGARYEIDWTLPPQGQLESGEDEAARLQWAVRPADSSSEKTKADGGLKTRTRVEQVLTDHPFEFTANQLAGEIGGNRERALEAIEKLLGAGVVEQRMTGRIEGKREVKRNRLGLVANPRIKFGGVG
ncbi:AAA family ATPase [Nocardia otitidiscaviarum]|uniref:AAA family ATPase n=1 Tax=Nocardia otitidiscaviarum TaxID=1823 RepID=UPI00189377CA|nr:AAA family ATPase [Nocardia otitidiscaviarum]MBF6131606.1 AAA family ATPase [Nocardia otitidiscaviarum]